MIIGSAAQSPGGPGSQEPPVSLSSQLGPDGSRIPFSPTSLQCLEIDMCHVFIVTTLCRCDTVWRMTGCNHSSLAVLASDTAQSHKESLDKISSRVSVLQYWNIVMFAEWDELFISEYWLCRPPICGRVTRYLDSKYWKVVEISEHNKDVTGLMLDSDNNTTNILISDSWHWWHSWVSSQPLSGGTGMWSVYWDIILFVTQVSPSQWVISTSVTRCDTLHFISELKQYHVEWEWEYNLWHLTHGASGCTGQVSP